MLLYDKKRARLSNCEEVALFVCDGGRSKREEGEKEVKVRILALLGTLDSQVAWIQHTEI